VCEPESKKKAFYIPEIATSNVNTPRNVHLTKNQTRCVGDVLTKMHYLFNSTSIDDIGGSLVVIAITPTTTVKLTAPTNKIPALRLPWKL
jgi:hypothetical protein